MVWPYLTFYQARDPAGIKQNRFGRSSDLSQSYRVFPEWNPVTYCCDGLKWDLQQRVLFRSCTGFPFHSPVGKRAKTISRLQSYIKTRIRSLTIESFVAIAGFLLRSFFNLQHPYFDLMPYSFKLCGAVSDCSIKTCARLPFGYWKYIQLENIKMRRSLS